MSSRAQWKLSLRFNRLLGLRYTACRMLPKQQSGVAAQVNPLGAADVVGILRERGWLHFENEDVAAWMNDAAALLGPHAPDRDALAGLLLLVFEYDARSVIGSRECQEVLARDGSREVIRMLASEILSGGPVDSARLKEIVTALKAKLPYSGREIFLALRVALTGRVGDGALDRIVLLLDRAAGTDGLAAVKSVRARILEFCSALD